VCSDKASGIAEIRKGIFGHAEQSAAASYGSRGGGRFGAFRRRGARIAPHVSFNRVVGCQGLRAILKRGCATKSEGSLMAITVRALLKSIAGVCAMVLGGAGSPVALGHPREILTLSDLIGRLRHSAALRDRFAENPRAVFLEFGIDPSPYNLSDRMNATQMDRLLTRFAQASTPTEPPTAPAPPEPPAVVYGPPPRPSPDLRPQPPAPVYGPPPGPSPSPKPSPQPPAPVYGPPPGRQK